MSGNDEAPRIRAPEAPFRLPLFAGFDRPVPILLIEALQQEKPPAGLVVFADNAPGEGLHIATSGRVQVRKAPDYGQDPVFAEMERSEWGSAMALLAEKPGSAIVLTLVATSLLATSLQTYVVLSGRLQWRPTSSRASAQGNAGHHADVRSGGELHAYFGYS